MTNQEDTINLTGKLLIAMPGMEDARFEKSVVFMCAHSPEGAMGLIINKPLADIAFKDLLKQLDVTVRPYSRDLAVHFGGPVEHGRGFVLHSNDYASDISTLRVADDFGMTATLDILESFGGGSGPHDAIMALGYAGWAPGQLEAEISQNGWLTCDADRALVFDTANADKWQAALKVLGIDALMLSSAAGHA